MQSIKISRMAEGDEILIVEGQTIKLLGVLQPKIQTEAVARALAEFAR